MVEAPEKIFAARGLYDIAPNVRNPAPTEYLRADIAERQIAELRAERDVQRQSKEFAQRCCEKAEADNARLSEALQKARVYVEMIVTDQFADTGTDKQDLAEIDAALSGSGAGGWREPNSGHVYSAADLARLLEWRDKFIVSKGLWGEFTTTLDRLPAAHTGDHHD